MVPRSDDRPHKDLSTFAALMGLLLLAGLLIFLAALVMPQVLGIVLVVTGFGGMFVLHYVLWGRWLSQMPPPDDDPTNQP